MATRAERTRAARAAYQAGTMTKSQAQASISNTSTTSRTTSSPTTTSSSKTTSSTPDASIMASFQKPKPVTTTKPTTTQTTTQQPVSVLDRAKKMIEETKAGSTKYTGGKVYDAETHSLKPAPTTPVPVGEELPADIGDLEPVTSEGKLVGLRDIAEGQGSVVGWDESTGQVTIDGVPVDLDGLSLQDGRYSGSEEQINRLINNARLGISKQGMMYDGVSGLRDYFQSRQMEVYWDEATGQVYINGVPIDTSNMGFVNGTYYASDEELKAIFEQVQQAQMEGVRQDLQQGLEPEIGLEGEGIDVDGAEGELLDVVEENALLKENGLNQYLEAITRMNNDYKEFSTKVMESLNNYKDVHREEALNIIRQAYGNPFKYDPDSDPALQEAMKVAERQIMSAMNSRGLLNSTITRDNMAQSLSSMLPQYENIAYNRYLKEKQNQLEYADVLMDIDEKDYKRFVDKIDYSLSTMKELTSNDVALAKETLQIYNDKLDLKETAVAQEVKNREAQIQRAYDLWDKYGFATNEVSAILGVPPNAPTNEIRKQLMAEQSKINQVIAKAQLDKIERTDEFNNKMAELDYKEEISRQNDAINEAKSAVVGNELARLQKFSPDSVRGQLDLLIEDWPTLMSLYPDAATELTSLFETLKSAVRQENIDNEANSLAWYKAKKTGSGGSGSGTDNKKPVLSMSGLLTQINNTKSEFNDMKSGGGGATIDNIEYVSKVLSQIDGANLSRDEENSASMIAIGVPIVDLEAEHLASQLGWEEKFTELSDVGDGKLKLKASEVGKDLPYAIRLFEKGKENAIRSYADEQEDKINKFIEGSVGQYTEQELIDLDNALKKKLNSYLPNATK